MNESSFQEENSLPKGLGPWGGFMLAADFDEDGLWRVAKKRLHMMMFGLIDKSNMCMRVE